MDGRKLVQGGGLMRLRCPSAVGFALALAVFVAWWGNAVPGWACDTPVYRYAMYRWTPMAYEAFYFHRGPVPKADQAVHAVLAERDKDGVAPNVDLTAVDLDRKDALETLPESVRKIWQDLGDKTLPRYVMVAPWGDHLFTGPIDVAVARQIVESPLRSAIGQRFHEGHGVVLLILEGDRAEENAHMETVARQVMSIAASGKLFADLPDDSNQPTPKDDSGTAAPSDDASPAKGSGGLRGAIRVALLKVNRSNAAETWLLKCLAAMTPDVQHMKPPYEPMLFAIYGRGRVMPPGIGKEVTVESLSGLLRFLGDRCSCTIKDQNPGLDLLMRWDWEATAERFSAEEEASPAPLLYAEMSADGGVSPPGKAEQSAGDQTVVAAAIAPVPLGPKPAGAMEPGPAPEAGACSPVALPGDDAPTQARAAEPFSSRQRWQLGLGLAGMALVVVVLGVILVRRQQHASS